MNLLKKAMNAIFFTVIVSSAIQCTSPKAAVVPLETPELKLQNPILFQEWYAGINVGGTGVNMYIPKFDTDRIIQVDSIYFRNMKGKLVTSDAMYSAILKNDSPNYDVNPSNARTNPFNLTANECIIRYTEDGQIKYHKIASVLEKAGTYYENGPPSMFKSIPINFLAAVDED